MRLCCLLRRLKMVNRSRTASASNRGILTGSTLSVVSLVINASCCILLRCASLRWLYQSWVVSSSVKLVEE